MRTVRTCTMRTHMFDEKKCKVHKSKLPLYTCNLLSEFIIQKQGANFTLQKVLQIEKGAFDLGSDFSLQPKIPPADTPNTPHVPLEETSPLLACIPPRHRHQLSKGCFLPSSNHALIKWLTNLFNVH